jgi:phosphoadenosine phosphosulfate reductase
MLSPRALLQPPLKPTQGPLLKVVGTDKPSSQSTKLELDPIFREELETRNQELQSAQPDKILQWAVEQFQDKLTFATAFGPEGMVILYLLSKFEQPVHCFNLDTGYQFAETLQLRDQVKQKYGIDVELCRPELTVEEYEKQNGKLHQTNPTQCCYDRKISVLHQVVQDKLGWVSAIRRDQSPDRSSAPVVGWDQKFSLVKINPLANWTKSDVWKTILDNEIPYNPLHDQGYPSIGCLPCTRSIQIGEDERAGRWSGSAKTECGLHSKHT